MHSGVHDMTTTKVNSEHYKEKAKFEVTVSMWIFSVSQVATV